MIRPPPRSTLFPYRRSSDLQTTEDEIDFALEVVPQTVSRLRELSPVYQKIRSEEHTSELQSRENLVCRLLLEKKKSITRTLSSLRSYPDSSTKPSSSIYLIT